MKSFTILTLFSILSSGFQSNATFTNAAEETGSNVLRAFRKSSVEEYCALLPSLSEFHQIMEENDKLYGGFLTEAKREFKIQYERELIPSVKEAFKNVLTEGSKRGINWHNIEFVRVENVGSSEQGHPTPFDIVFREKGKEYTLRIDNAFVWQDQWRVTQFIVLR
jgi:hypothetical protein